MRTRNNRHNDNTNDKIQRQEQSQATVTSSMTSHNGKGNAKQQPCKMYWEATMILATVIAIQSDSSSDYIHLYTEHNGSTCMILWWKNIKRAMTQWQVITTTGKRCLMADCFLGDASPFTSQICPKTPHNCKCPCVPGCCRASLRRRRRCLCSPQFKTVAVNDLETAPELSSLFVFELF